MQFHEILEEHTIKAISAKTNIAEVNINALAASDFEKIKKIKTLGFISIIEREYHADLSALRAEALEYYSTVHEDQGITLNSTTIETKKGKSKFFKFIVLILIGYAIWYAFINFDKEKLKDMLPFSDDTLSQMIMPDKKNVENKRKTVEELSIEYAQSSEKNTEENKTD